MFDIKQGGQREPLKIAIYGTNGIGKTTFAASMPRPFVVAVEKGVGNLRVNYGEADQMNFDQVMQSLYELSPYFSGPNRVYDTLVIDSLDALQPKVWEKVCRENGKKNIEDFGYGKGYTVAQDQWRKLIDMLNRYNVELGINVVTIAQVDVKAIKDPIHGNWDRFVPRLHKTAMGGFGDWADIVGFAQQKVTVYKDADGNNRVNMLPERVLNLTPHPSYFAKNRYNMPAELPLSWQALDQAINQAFGMAPAGHAPAQPQVHQQIQQQQAQQPTPYQPVTGMAR
jgi:hypothetical protein